MAVHRDLLRSPQDYSHLLADLRPTRWPPSKADIEQLANYCMSPIAKLDEWEITTRGRNVVDTRRGEITTADARRLLARKVGVGAEGDVTVLLVPEGEERVRIELHAFAEDEGGVVLSRPELVLTWEHNNPHGRINTRTVTSVRFALWSPAHPHSGSRCSVGRSRRTMLRAAFLIGSDALPVHARTSAASGSPRVPCRG